MEKKTFIPNQNRQVLRMLAREFGKWNRGRNRILMSAVTLCIVTLTMVFGIASGKTKAEYIKAVRAAGTTASVRIEHAENEIYQKIEDLSYVKESGRSISVGEAAVSEKHVCNLEVLDTSAWNKLVSPAYTEIHGHYPEKKRELMLSAKSLQQLGIETPKQGMKLSLTVQIGLFQTAQETFLLSGWYTDYTDSQASVGYVSEEKGKEWGYDLQETSDILLAQTDGMEWQKTEERLYRDLGGKELKITADNTFAYEAINRLTGGYELAVCGALVILFGMFLLIYNVMKISMNRDIQQMGLLYTIGTTKRQIKRIYFRQILTVLLPGVLLGSLFSGMILHLLIPEILGSRYLNGYGGDSYAWNGVACDPPCSQHILRGEYHSHLRNPSTFKKEGEFEEADKNRRNRLYGMAECKKIQREISAYGDLVVSRRGNVARICGHYRRRRLYSCDRKTTGFSDCRHVQ